MATPIQTRARRSQRGDQKSSALEIHSGISLEKGRIHEICGNARHTFAVMLAGRTTGTILWISPAWQAGMLNPDGLNRFANPGDFVFVSPRHANDLLWSMEEALRSGACPVVVADLPDTIPLTPLRRLLLAAETGGREGHHRPLGLILAPGNGGTRGIESRWHFQGNHEPGKTAWKLSRIYARSAPPARWHVARKKGSLSFSEEKTRPDT